MRSEPVKNTRDPRQLELPVGGRTSDAPGDAAERAVAIVESLPKLNAEEVFAAFEELDQLPSEVVRKALAASTGPAPDPNRLDDAMRRAHGFPPRPLRLRTLAVVKDADIFDLGSVAEEQLRLAGKAWDGVDLSAEERLDGENEGSFAGTVEHHVLADADASGIVPRFDVVLHAEDAGSIFRAGTTELVGAIAYGMVELKDKRARVAIQEALAKPFEESSAFEPEPEPEPEPEAIEAVAVPAAKKAVVVAAPAETIKSGSAAKKKSVAGPKSTKKASAEPKKKAPAEPKKKASAEPKKTGVAKKTAAKKATAAKETPKKTSAKDSAAKKTAAKKTSAKKAAPKATSAKKAPSTADNARAKTTAAKSENPAKKAASKKSATKR